MRLIDFIRNYIQNRQKTILILVTITLLLQTLFGFFYFRSLKNAFKFDDENSEFSGEVLKSSGHQIEFTPAEIAFFLKNINVSPNEFYDYHIPKIDSIKILLDKKNKELQDIRVKVENAKRQNTDSVHISALSEKNVLVEEQISYYKEILSFWKNRSKGLRNLVKTLGLDSITCYLWHRDSLENVLARSSPPKIQSDEKQKEVNNERAEIKSEDKSYIDHTLSRSESDSETNKLIPKAMSKTVLMAHSPSPGISKNEMIAMIRQYDFFDYYWNNNGKGFKNAFIARTFNENDVVLDEATQLMWQQSGSSNPMKYKETTIWIEDLNSSKFAGYQDWRLPTLKEAMSLLEPEKKELYIDTIFSNKQKWIYTSDCIEGESCVWVVSFSLGGCRSSYSLELGNYFVRAVRSSRR